MRMLLRPENVRGLRLVLLLLSARWLIAKGKLSACSKANEGNRALYRKVSGDDGVVVCLKHSGRYVWRFLDGSSTFGEKFDPAKDCSDIVDNLSEANDGFYWIKHDRTKLSKAWCDTHTDGGGFMLVGMETSPMSWNVPSNGNPVNPMGPPHWSSKFGDVSVQDFAIKISTTKNFADTMAHWSYRLKVNRALGDLLGGGRDVCTDFYSGIGNVSYVKDILTETVVTKTFNCSKFGPHTGLLGWRRMNYCLRNKCPKGYAFVKGFPSRLDNHGSFSYSASSEFSGITHDATAFVGCDTGKCCACFGPKGGRGHYCGRKCKAINGGTVLTGRVYVWYWIRTRMPERLWKRCMEFEMKTEAGKFQTFFIDKKSGTAHKGTCSEQFQTLLSEGTLLVKNQHSFENLPQVPGLLSYREDNEKLYVRQGNRWDAIISEEQTRNLTNKVQHLKANMQENVSQQDAQTKNLQQNINAKLQGVASKNSQQDAQISALQINMRGKLQNLNSKDSQQDAQTENLKASVTAKLQRLASKNSKQNTRTRQLEIKINEMLRRFISRKSQQSKQYKNMEADVTVKSKSLDDRLKKIQKKFYTMPTYGSKLNPAKSCKYIQAAKETKKLTGIYWIEPTSQKLFEVYCDMETRGGGWTLVYSYTFTHYNSFSSSSNAVTPRPNWPASSSNVSMSTTPPLSESSRGAVDWNMWKYIGKEFMVKSNINDWIVCQPNSGSLVTSKYGSISCQNIKNVATACSGYAPDTIVWNTHGPYLKLGYRSIMYYFEGNTGAECPIHDPCARSSTRQKNGVSHPSGQIYVR